MGPSADINKPTKKGKRSTRSDKNAGAQDGRQETDDLTQGLRAKVNITTPDKSTGDVSVIRDEQRNDDLNVNLTRSSLGNDVDMPENDDSLEDGEVESPLRRNLEQQFREEGLFPPLQTNSSSVSWVDMVNDELTLDMAKPAIEKILAITQNAADALESLIYDYHDRVSRIKDSTTKIEALAAFNHDAGAKQRHIELTFALKQCEQMLTRINEQQIATSLPTQSKRSYAFPLTQGEQSMSSQEFSLTPGSSRKRSSDTGGRSYGRAKYRDDGQYSLILTSTSEKVMDIKAAVYAAIENLPVHVDRFEPRGLGGVFHFRTGLDLETTADAIKIFKYHGDHLINHYSINMEVKSKFVLQTDLVPHSRFAEIPFIKEGRIDINSARDRLHKRNKQWFSKPEDIINMTYRNVQNGHNTGIQFTLYLTKAAHANALADKRWGVKLDLIGDQTVIYDATPKIVCFRCHERGHVAAACPQPYPQCKFCLAKHLSSKCPLKDDEKEHTCYKCRDFNIKNPTKPKRDERHFATHPECPTAIENRIVAKAERMKNTNRK